MRDSKIILSKKMLMDKNYKNVLNFTNEQILNIMQSNEHLVDRADDYSFIKESTNTILVNFTYNQCLTANYIAFQNPRYSSKWFFAWIDSVEYYSEKATKITFTIDNWSTWFEKLEFKTAFVVREHVNDDTIGKHTTDEGIGVEGVVAEGAVTDFDLSINRYICVTSNWKPESETGFNGISLVTGTVFGSTLVLFDYSMEGFQQLFNYIFVTNGQGHVADIKNVFIIPGYLIEKDNLGSPLLDTVNYIKDVAGVTVQGFYYRLPEYGEPWSFDSARSPVVKTINIPKRYQFDDYQPKNNKLFCYPFNYLHVTNNAGSSNIYKYEDFLDSTNPNNCAFQQQVSLSVGCSGRTVPRYYKKIIENIDESIPLAKYPVCEWSADSYTNWLTENAVNHQTAYMNLGFSAAKTVLGGITGGTEKNPSGGLMNVMEGTISIANQVMSLYNGFYQAQLLPNIVGGQATGDVSCASNDIGFMYTFMRAKTEFLIEIDSFFTRFGYKVIRNKIPNITGRQNFNYIEIGQGETFAYGEVPANSLYEINQIARNGVTIWHNHENIGNYDISNNIV